MEKPLTGIREIDRVVCKQPKAVQKAVLDLYCSDDLELVRESIKIHSDLDKLRIKEVCGYMFEMLSYHWLRRLLEPEGYRLLSPRETFEVYKIMFPSREAINFGSGLQQGLDGIAIPDGWLLKRQGRMTRVMGISEYSLAPNTNYNLKSRGGLFKLNAEPLKDLLHTTTASVGRYIHKQHPSLPSRVYVDYGWLEVDVVIPQDAGISDSNTYSIYSLPISKLSFSQLVNAALTNMRKDTECLTS